MHHKRKRPKNRRAGCLMCKPHKMNGAKDRATMQERRAPDVDSFEPDIGPPFTYEDAVRLGRAMMGGDTSHMLDI